MSNHTFLHLYRERIAKLTYVLVILSLLIPNGIGLGQSLTATPTAGTPPVEPSSTGAPPSPTDQPFEPTAEATASPTITTSVELSPTLTTTAEITPTATATATETAVPTLPEPSPSPTASPTASLPPPTATESPTDTATPTASPTVTATSALTPTATLQPGEISLSLAAAPGPLSAASVAPDMGDVITITWQIAAAQPLDKGAALQVTLPDGLKPNDAKLGAFDEKMNTLSLVDPTSQGTLAIRIGTQSKWPYQIGAALLDKDQVITYTQFELHPAWQADISQEGGSVSAFGGRVKLTFPKEALPEGVQVSIRSPERDTLPKNLVSDAPFEVTALGKSDKSLLHQFKAPLTFEYFYNDGEFAVDPSALVIVYYDEEQQDWMPIDTEVDETNHRLIAHPDHLSLYDIMAQNWEADRLPNLESFQTSQFTGAATYEFPIQVPPGPGGLQPSLSLSYNSQVVDAATSWTQASWAGMGWSIDTGYIQRNQKSSPDYFDDDTFTLNMNGVSGLLLPVDETDQHAIQYRLADNNFWKIIYHKYDGNVGGYNGDISYWELIDKTGTKYYFEDHAWYPAKNPDCQHYYMQTWQYNLSRVVNIFNQTMAYTYAYDSEVKYAIGCTGQASMEMSAYPSEVKYAWDGQRYRYRVLFNTNNNRLDMRGWEGFQKTTLHMHRLLSEIRVEQDADGNGDYETLIRRYQLGYNENSQQIFPNVVWPQGGKTPTLTSIKEYGLNDVSLLPPTNFTYDGMHLTQADNGYGGRVNYTYEAQPWYEYGHIVDPYNARYHYLRYSLGSYIGYHSDYFPGSTTDFIHPGQDYLMTVDSGDGCYTVTMGLNDPSRLAGINLDMKTAILTMPKDASSARFFVRCDYPHGGSYKPGNFIVYAVVSRYRVLAKTVTDQVTSKSFTTKYHYEGGATNNLANRPFTNYNDWYTDIYSEYRGNNTVTETGPDGKVTTTFYNQDEYRKGRSNISIAGTQSFSDTFNSLNSSNWYSTPLSYTTSTITNEVALKGYNSQENYNATIYRTSATINPVSGNANSVMMQFFLSGTQVQSVMYLSRGTHGQSDYRRWELWAKPSGSYWIVTVRYAIGTSWTQVTTLVNDFKTNRWYVFRLGMDNQHLLAQVWERDIPAMIWTCQITTPSQMQGDQNWRFQQETYRGTVYLDEYSEGRIYTFNRTSNNYDDSFTPSSLPAIKDSSPLRHYNDLDIAWTYPISQTNLSFEGTTNWTGTASFYFYDTDDQGGGKYGNQTQVVESSWNGSAWSDYRETVTPYYPNISSAYLVGLPGYTNQYSCPSGSLNGGCKATMDGMSGSQKNPLLLSSAWYLYDLHTSYNAVPTTGALTGQRTFLRFNGANYTDPKYSDVRYRYDAWGNRSAESHSPDEGSSTCCVATNLYTTTTTYDPTYHAYPISQVNPAAHVTSWIYDYALGVPTSETLPNGGTTLATYDAYGRITKVAKPGDNLDAPTLQMRYYDGEWYNSKPFYTILTQKLQGSTYFNQIQIYDGLGRKIQTRMSVEQLSDGDYDVVTDFSYDYTSSGQVVKQSVPYKVAWWNWQYNPFVSPQSLGTSTETTSDILGRVVKVKAPDQSDATSQRYTYSLLVSTTTDPNGHITTTTLDARGRTVQIAPAAGPSVSYTYDNLDRLITASRGGYNTTMAYDYAGRKTSMNDPDMGNWTYSYYALGNLKTQTDARNCITTLSYDSLSRLTGKTYSGTCSGMTSISYTYDAYNPVRSLYDKGYRTGMTDASGSTTWRYDARGRMTYEYKSVNGSGNFLTQWDYNSADLVTMMTYPGGNGGQAGEQVSTSYKNQLTVNQVTASGITYAQNAYDEAGRVVSRTLGGGVVNTTYGYYSWTYQGQGGRLQTLTSAHSTTNLQSLSYTYDAVGNIKTILDGQNSNQKQCFSYDSADRLIKGTTYTDNINGCTTQLGTGNYDEYYSYDTNTGNLSSKTGLGTYTYNSTHKHAVASASGVSFQYDANGNMTRRVISGVTFDLTYDGENQLTAVSSPANATFFYDGDGKRVKGTVSGTTTVYIGNYYEWTGSTSTSKKYYYAGTVRIAMRTGPTTLNWLLGDHLGSTNRIANGDGSPINPPITYKPWGETRTGTSPTTYKFTGQRQESALGGTEGLYYYGARWYDDALGRWASPDPIIPDPYNPADWDRYSYVRNNPVNFTDPTGHSACWDDNANDPECKNYIPTSNGIYDKTAHPDAPPDLKNRLPNGNPPPPHVDGLPDDEWEWNSSWPDLGEGYRNNQDPTETVWRPDDGYTNEAGNEGELPHWNGRAPGDTGKGVDFPGNNKWGRPGQPKQPGVFDPLSGRYAYSPIPQDFTINIPRLPLPNPTNSIPTIIILLLLTPVLILVP